MPVDEAKRALDRLHARAELRSAGEDEDSAVIEERALSRRPKSDPVPVRGLVAVLNTLPPGWGRVLVVLALIAAIAALVAGGKLASWF